MVVMLPALVFGLAVWPTECRAHTKWFAPYIVEASPRPVTETLTNAWFWLAIALVVLSFVATVAVERMAPGQAVLGVLDRVTAPLWRRADDFLRAAIGAFFVAVFAVGEVYLTPDLKTPAEWVSWAQLLIAAGVFSRWTMPFSAAGIIALWVIALRDYDFFHLLDYLTLGLGVAAYLVLASLKDSKWRNYRFMVLRAGVAIALMWSSLEKFAYPEWFYPLEEERAYLTFGLPRDIFIPMAGVAEFTMGLGLMWTPLVRRLSALSLIVIFAVAVYPFGRIDLVGHALIMAPLFLILADQSGSEASSVAARGASPVRPRALAAVPAGLAAALAIVLTSYWGLHAVFYGAEGDPAQANAERITHSRYLEYPHEPQAPEGAGTSPDQQSSNVPQRAPSAAD